MKRLVLISISLLAMLSFAIQSNAVSIDMISQTYHIAGGWWHSGLTIGVTSSVPPLIAPYPFSGYCIETGWCNDLHADGGATGSSGFVDLSASSVDGGTAYASAELVFLLTGASSLDLSYSFEMFLGYFSDGHLVLSDSTTGVTLVSVSAPSSEYNFTEGSVRVPIVSSDIYRLFVECGSNTDPAGAIVTFNAVPEPTTMLLLASGLIGLIGLRKRLRK